MWLQIETVGFCDHSNEHSGYIKCREYLDYWSRDSSVGIATDYGQDGSVFESRQGRDIASSITVSVLYSMGTGVLSWGTVAGV
jgi:hypothetical protein